MIELSKERIEEILNEETAKDISATVILRSIYLRYMRVYEKYFEDLDALDEEAVAALRKYNEETISLTRYYRMDIPQDICNSLKDFEEKYGSKLIGPGWQSYLSDNYEQFSKKSKYKDLKEEDRKAEFAKQGLSYFYDVMDYVFRDGFGTGSDSAKHFVNGLTELFFGKDK